jgi:hypothetical protein
VSSGWSAAAFEPNEGSNRDLAVAFFGALSDGRYADAAAILAPQVTWWTLSKRRRVASSSSSAARRATPGERSFQIELRRRVVLLTVRPQDDALDVVREVVRNHPYSCHEGTCDESQVVAAGVTPLPTPPTSEWRCR